MSVSVWVSKISFKTGFSGFGLGLSFYPRLQHKGRYLSLSLLSFRKNMFGSHVTLFVLITIKSSSCILGLKEYGNDHDMIKRKHRVCGGVLDSSKLVVLSFGPKDS